MKYTWTVSLILFSMQNNTNKTLAAINDHNKSKLEDTSKTELTSIQELGRYVSINLICVIVIMFLMSFCYMSHVFYNNAWKPFKSFVFYYF